MIVGDSFAGDTNVKLMWIQHDLYRELVVYLFTQARERYSAAVRLVGVNTELRLRVATVEGFDHRVLQGAHDKIAAYYRFAHDPRGQMPLPFDGLPYEEYLIGRWCSFFSQEVRRLVEIDEVSIAIITAVAYENTPRGYQAEDLLMEILTGRYGDFDTATYSDGQTPQAGE